MNEMMGGMDGEQPEGEPAEGGGRSGSSVCINCYDDGTYDVYAKPLEPASEQQYPDGMFGLSSIEDALKAVIALKQGGQSFEPAGHAAMMKSYQDSASTRKEPGGY